MMSNHDALNISHHAPNKTAATVNYQSNGRVLAIGNDKRAQDAIRALNLNSFEKLSEITQSDTPHIIGHLGNFRIFEHEAAEEPLAQFDIIVDVGNEPIFDYEVPPFGYYRLHDENSITKAREEIPQLTGEFDKPRYFLYESKRCAHQRRGLVGCTNCIDACSAGAAIAFGDGIKINPWLCQGCASCAVACPSGAISYNWPSLEVSANELKRFVDSGVHGIAIVTEATNIEKSIDKSWAVIEMHEVNAIGPELLMYVIARGVRSIIIEKPTHQKTHQAIIDNNRWLNSITQAALSSDISSIIQIIDADQIETVLVNAPNVASISLYDDDNDSALFSEKPGGEAVKRTLLRSTISALLAKANVNEVSLAQQAPFGDITIDAKACTLCMSCVNVCPSLALKDGGDAPEVNFNQSLCLQCGLCEQSCPENAMVLIPQFDVSAQNEHQYAPRNATAKFHCIRCDAPFATEKMIETITERLMGSTYFNSEEEVNRLKMCADCRVVDLLQQEEAQFSKQDSKDRGRLV